MELNTQRRKLLQRRGLGIRQANELTSSVVHVKVNYCEDSSKEDNDRNFDEETKGMCAVIEL